MSAVVDNLQLIDSLHYAMDYIPKRALRFFSALENQQETVSLLVEEIEEVLEHPAEFVEEGSQFLFYALMILGHFRSKEAIPLIRELGFLDQEAIDELLGERLFDSVSLAIAQIFSEEIDRLKVLIEDVSMDECIRATCVQSIIYLYGQRVLSRDHVVAYFINLLKKPREKISFFYEVIINASLILHPKEMIEEIRKIVSEGIIDASDVSLEDVEEFLAMDAKDVIAEGKEAFKADLDDLVAYFESIEGFHQGSSVERNEACPCGSGVKYKKCCY